MDFTFVGATRVSQTSQITGFRISPNPSGGYLRIEGTTEVSQDMEIKVYNLLGQQLFSRELHQVHSFEEILDLQNFQDGPYILMVRMENGTVQAEKIMITKD
jgi:hypothetical protein